MGAEMSGRRVDIIYIGGKTANDRVSFDRSDWAKLDRVRPALSGLFHNYEPGRFRAPTLSWIGGGPFYLTAPHGEYFTKDEVTVVRVFYQGVMAALNIKPIEVKKEAANAPLPSNG
jgi:hypothetical protein